MESSIYTSSITIQLKIRAQTYLEKTINIKQD